jgi:hypothetical protein
MDKSRLIKNGARATVAVIRFPVVLLRVLAPLRAIIFVFGLGIVCTMLLAACSSRVTVPAAEAPLLPASAVYAAVRRQEAAVQSLRARFTVRLRHGTEVRNAAGVLLVKKPERFRLRLLSPFGLTVFDYTSWDGHDRMQLPLEGRQFSDAEIAAHATFSPADMREVFLGSPGAAEECSAQDEGAETVVDCRDGAGALTRVLHIQTATRHVSREVQFGGGHPNGQPNGEPNGQPKLIMRFDDYRRVADVELPFTIDLTNPEKGVTIEITVRSYEVNPSLADSLFAASPPGGARS